MVCYRSVGTRAWLWVRRRVGGRVTGVGRFFRADEVHVENSVGVVAGDRCRLLAEDHFHVYRATIDFGVLLDPPQRLREALAALVTAPDDRDALTEFAAELRRVSGVVVLPESGVEERRIAPRCSVSIADSVGVQLGDGTQLNIHHEYVVEQIEIPLIELLTHEDVLRQFAHALAASDDPEAMTDLLRTMTEALELVDDEVLAALSEPQAGSDTLLHSLFGRAEITCAEPVMIGVGNELERTTEYCLPGLRHRDVDTALAAVFDDITIPERAEPEESVKEPDELLEEESAPIKH